MYIVLFDGVCNFCNSSVQFILKRDPKALFRFAALQSEQGQAILKQHHLATSDFDSIVLLREADGTLYQRSSAALHIAKKLSGAWPLLYGFMIVPPFIRDAVYNFIAKRRYRWFGQREACMLPTPEQRARFL